MNSSILTRYVTAANTHGEATLKGDYQRANAAHDDIVGTLRDLRQKPDRGHELLGQLLLDECVHVRLWAATHLLALDEKSAIKALDNIQRDALPLISFNAQMVLTEWRAGRLKIEGDEQS